jgi:hypothetical protein
MPTIGSYHQALYDDPRLPALAAAPAGSLKAPSGNLLFERFRCRLTRTVRRNDLARTEHGHSVRDRERLFDPMRDQDDGATFRPQLPHLIQQRVGLLSREHRRRFVEDHNLASTAKRPRDLDSLLLAYRKFRGDGIEREIFGLAGICSEEQQILAYREGRDEHKVLVNDVNPKRSSFGGVLETDGRPVKNQLSARRRQSAGENGCKGGLAGAVLAKNGVDLASAEGEADAPKGLHFAELLANVPYFEYQT